jgi:hypothetical protein
MTAAHAVEITLGPVSLVPNTTRPPLSGYLRMPDSHTAVLPSRDGKRLLWFWSGPQSHRVVVEAATLDNLDQVPRYPEPGSAVMMSGPKGSEDEHGAWLNFVFRQGNGDLIALYHGETGEFAERKSGDRGEWFYAMRAISKDDGITWKEREVILSNHGGRPQRPTYGGISAHGAFQDKRTNRYWVYFWEGGDLSAAVSDSPLAEARTWRKYHRDKFNEPGLGGECLPLPGLEGCAGRDMCVHWNEYLNRYVMILGTWTPSDVLVTFSDDLLHWDKPQVLLEKAASRPDEVRRYFTLVGTSERQGTSDQACGRRGWLMYQYKPTQRSPTDRFWYRRTIEFRKADTFGVVQIESDSPVTDALREARKREGGPRD